MPAGWVRRQSWKRGNCVGLEDLDLIFAVLFLKLVLEVTKAAELPWQILVLPVGVLVLALSVWLIRHSEH